MIAGFGDVTFGVGGGKWCRNAARESVSPCIALSRDA